MVSDRVVFFVVPSNPLQRSALSRGTIKFLMPHILLLLLLLRLALWLWPMLSVLDLENFFNLPPWAVGSRKDRCEVHYVLAEWRSQLSPKG